MSNDEPLSLGILERPDTLTERACAQLRVALIEGVFSPGEKITIRGVAKALGVSPTPAREALNILVAEGALLAGPHKSVKVPALTVERLREITELRVALETVAAEMALPRLSAAEIVEIAAKHEAMLAATEAGDSKRVLERNAEFHFAIYRKADAPMLLKMIESVWLRSGAYLRVAYPEYGLLRKGLDNHAKVIAALCSRNAKALRAAIERDIRDSSAHLYDALERLLAREAAG